MGIVPVLDASLRRRLAQRTRADGLLRCWHWTGQLDRHGYGRISVRRHDGRFFPMLAHRAAWLAGNGSEPPTELHHVCRNRACVNPFHLAAMHHDAHGAEHRLAVCANGHPMSDSNVISRDGHRRCRMCARATERAWRAANAASINERRRARRAQLRSLGIIPS